MKGVVGELIQNGGENSPLTDEKNYGYIALMDGKIPPSAGLSSSSAVVVAAALCMYYWLIFMILPFFKKPYENYLILHYISFQAQCGHAN